MPSNEGLGVRLFRVLIVGGSYGGLSTALALIDLTRGRRARFDNRDAKAYYNNNNNKLQIPIEITVVDERDGYYHLIGSPKALACDKFAPKSWTRFEDIPALQVPGLHMVQGTVKSVDCQRKTAEIEIFESNTKRIRQEKYDFLVAASGLRRSFPTVPQSFRREEFLAEAKMHIQDIQKAQDGVVIVGGGAVGVEMAAELKMLDSTRKITLIHSRDHLLSSEPLPDDFKQRVCSVLRDTGVEVILGNRVLDTAIETQGERRVWQLTLADGSRIKTGHVLGAISRTVPTSTYLPEAALDKEGYVKIHPTLQFLSDLPNAAHHFAIGDLASWPGIKRCGGAMHMGYYAASNIHQLILEQCTGRTPEFLRLQQTPPVIGLALGKKAVAYNATDGTRDGEDLMASMFGEDMGNTICWNYMRLGEATA